MSHGESKKAIIAALLANLGIALSKFVAFLLTASASMLAESIHSAADTTNQGLLLLGGRRAKREATEQHPFGFGRERYFWSFVVSLMGSYPVWPLLAPAGPECLNRALRVGGWLPTGSCAAEVCPQLV